MNDLWYVCYEIVWKVSILNPAQSSHLTVWIETLGHHVCSYIIGMVNYLDTVLSGGICSTTVR